MTQDVSTLTTLDLTDQQSGALQNGAWATYYLRLIRQQLSKLVLTAEGEIEDAQRQTGAVAALLTVEEHAISLAETLREVAAQHVALLQMAQNLLQQRQAAEEQITHLYDELTAWIAEAQDIPREHARTLLHVLINPDEQVMQWDVCDLGSLLAFRDGVNALIDQLGYED